MWEQLILMGILGAFAFILYRLGLLRVVKKIGYVHKKFGNRLSVSYKKFHGFDYYYFRLPENKQITLTYEVAVDDGSLNLELRNKKGSLFTKTFTADEKGDYFFVTNGKWHSIKVRGDETKGGCKVEFREEKEDKRRG